MFKRLAYSLFKPKHIALFIKDKIYMSFIYLFIAIFLCALPSILKYVNSSTTISWTEYNNAINEIALYSDSNAKIVDSKFSINESESFKVKIDGYYYLFGNQEVSSFDTYFYFSTDSFELHTSTGSAKTLYKDLGYENIDFSSLTTSNDESIKFKSFLDDIYAKYFRYSNSTYISSQIFSTIIEVLIALVIVFVLVSFLMPFLQPKHKFNLCVYSFSWFYITYIIGSLMGATIIEYVGLIVSFFFIRKAMSSIKIVNIKKK